MSSSSSSVTLDSLPALVLLHLGMQLELASLAAAQQTCKRLHAQLNHRFIYRVLYEREYGHAVTLCCLQRRLVRHLSFFFFSHFLFFYFFSTKESVCARRERQSAGAGGGV